VKTTATEVETVAKNRNPVNDVPNNLSETQPKKGVTGGYATYPHERCVASSSVANSSR